MSGRKKVIDKILETVRWRINLYIERIAILEGPLNAADPTASDVYKMRCIQEALTLRGVIFNFKQDFYPHLNDVKVP